jgi:CRISPR-associated protein Cas1
MYQMRFPDPPDEALTLQQLRGKEGIRVRDSYQKASEESGVPWHGRSYNRGAWSAADPVNRALSSATSCLYGVCHAAIVAAGYSPALGFIHTGKMLSFVYDVADLYKPEIAIPIAFNATAKGTEQLERRVRVACREAFHHKHLLARIVRDIDFVLQSDASNVEAVADFDDDAAQPGGLWDPDEGAVAGGVNHAPDVD